MNSLHIKRGDKVIVTVGDTVGDKARKGKIGTVIKASYEDNTVIVEGVNMQKHHKKARSAKDAGGINAVAGPISANNVALFCGNSACEKYNRATRVKHIMVTDPKTGKQKKVRACCKCGYVFDQITEKKAAKTAAKAAVEDKKTKTDKKATEKKPSRKKAAKTEVKAEE